MYKKIIIIFGILLIICSSIFAIWKGNNNQSDEDDLKSKVDEEMSYIGKSIIELANELNNITIEEYKVTTQINNTSTKQTGEKENSSSTDSDSNSSSDSSSQENTSGGSNNSSSNNITTSYKILPNTQNTNDINWNEIESKLNNLYSTWSQVVLDLYKINNNNDNILTFEKDLDETAKYIKNKEKVNSLSLVAKLYSYIPKFISEYSPENTRKINIEYAKSSIINSYALIEQEKWNEIKSEISKAEDNYNKILNDIDNNKNQYNINKGYILLKEYQNSVDLNDKEVLYIRYKNLIEEIINID